MASFEFDNVKAEKEDALWRYNMGRKLKIGLRFTGVFVALFFFLWSTWFPTLIPDAAVKVAGDFHRHFVSTFNKPLFTFVLVNIIILVVYVLSSPKQTQNKQTTTSTPDIYDEYVSSRRRIATPGAIATTPSSMEEDMVDKQIILFENAAALSPVKQLPPPTTVDEVTEQKISFSPVKQRPTTNPPISSTEFKQKEYRRTRSVVSETRNQGLRKFRRSETAISRELMVSGIEPPRKSIDEMSSEEFQLSIESFIAERKKILLQENTAHYTRRSMSIVVNN